MRLVGKFWTARCPISKSIIIAEKKLNSVLFLQIRTMKFFEQSEKLTNNNQTHNYVSLGTSNK